MTQYFRSLPRELEEAAYVDGASPLAVFWQILLPLTVPGLVSTGLLAFIAAWNEFLFAPDLYRDRPNEDRAGSLSHSLAGATSYEQPWGSIMAASMVVTIPARHPGHDLPVPDRGGPHSRRRKGLARSAQEMSVQPVPGVRFFLA